MKKVFTNEIKTQISKLAGVNDRDGIRVILNNFIEGHTEYKVNSNEYHIRRFLSWLDGETEELQFEMFKVGNSKLPFLNFSTLPVVTCIGAGACKTYCYSFKAWRYPASFLRQVQNTLLMSEFDTIKRELKRVLNTSQFRDLEKVDFRLYVDGDFFTETDLVNWMELIRDNPRLITYGYSKSLNLFLKLHDEGYKFPSNYALNLSNGGKYDDLKKFLKGLYFVRGEFTAMKVEKGENIRDNFDHKVFVCPSVCGECTNIGHACGNLDTFKDFEIVIQLH
jgi:hypothetical protein